MGTLISHSPEETQQIGEDWGRAALPGWVIGLTGELGAGKTQLVKGLARGLGVPVRVHSPTFTLVNEYRGGRLPLFHIDLYRLATPEQITGAGLEEYLAGAIGVVVVEWAERWPAFWLPNASRITHHASRITPFRRVVIESLDDTTRRLTYEDFGA
ncbi:MAG: tRNA (adenosine(37)-N6)-threonylcarbamoyltransferase complex ATPase subunit type 1 TsaE [Verrucomicrobia bacterium]|nr:tRNA (adenosine(37)-N6)-threonylcarbamoyltransferase complex ATPase subunit type 1 TsaE [Verrucomicrobiota bacterium]